MKHSIDIVICCFNEESTIQECIESLLRSHRLCQHKTFFTITILDDGSLDKTYEVASLLVHSNPEIIRLVKRPHLGLSSTRQHAAEISQSPYILYIDADATVDENLLPSYEKYFLTTDIDASVNIAFYGRVIDINPANKYYKYHYKPQMESGPHGLIGANMCWDKEFLLLNPFCSDFVSRGDETYLLHQLSKSSMYSPPIYIKEAIVMNSFTSDFPGFLRERFLNGKLNANIALKVKPSNLVKKRFVLLASYLSLLSCMTISFILTSPILFSLSILTIVPRYSRSRKYLFYDADSSPPYALLHGFCIRLIGLSFEDLGYLMY